MAERLSPQEEVLTFERIVDLLPEKEREKAKSHLAFYRRLFKHSDRKAFLLLYKRLVGFIKELEKEKGGQIRRCKLFHLYAGSSLGEKEWQALPLDTPEGDFERLKENLKEEFGQDEAAN